MKGFELFVWLLIFGFAVAVAFYLASYVDAQAHSAIGAVAAQAGVGVELGPNVDVYVGGGSVLASPGSGRLYVERGACVHVSNSTWWDVVCGPAALNLSGVYHVALWHADTSLQKDFAKNLSAALFWALAAIAIAAWVLYEYYR